MSLFINWQVCSITGWGNYGSQLALGVLNRKRPVFAMAVDGLNQYPPLTRTKLSVVGDWRRMHESVKSINVRTALMAYGNGAGGGPFPEGVTATSTAAAIFFEDTAWTEDQLDTLRKYPVVIAGSTWNADILRAKGLTNVQTVIQGVNPAEWHPAPRDPAFAGRFVVFSGGKLEFRKGQDIVIAAFRRFRMKHPEALLITAWQNVWPDSMVGIDLGGHAAGLPKIAPDGQAKIVDWLEKNGIPRTACLDVGLMPNCMLPGIVRACDVAVFPNRAEGGTNLAAMECIAAGVPTICAMNTGQLDLRGWCIPLNEQGPVPTGCPLYKGTEGWGESDVVELVDAMEHRYRNRESDRVFAAKNATAFIAQHDWQSVAIPKLLDYIEPGQAGHVGDEHRY